MKSKGDQEKKPSSNRAALLNRRDALKILGVTGSAVIATQVVTTGPLSTSALDTIGRQTHKTHASGEHEWHMVIDLDKCIGCQYCIRACQATNNVPDDDMRWNVGFPETTATGVDFYMTRPCLHCQEAPCVKVCPVGATWIREDGIVVMDYDRCIGCRYCQVACPYDVRRFNWKDMAGLPNPYQPRWGSGDQDVPARPRGVIEKCTFCVHRIDRGMEQGLTPGVDKPATPACVNICPVGARVFGDINDSESPVSIYMADHDTFRLREDFGTEPKVHYVRPQKEA